MGEHPVAEAASPSAFDINFKELLVRFKAIVDHASAAAGCNGRQPT